MTVYFGLPTYNGFVHEGLFGAFLKATQREAISKLATKSYSALCYNFNGLFCNALNERSSGITHFLLLHADVLPDEMWWVDKMLDLMAKHEADILSVVIPIKFEKGLTSTAIYESVEGSDPYYRPRRLSLHEIYNDYPPTFTDEKLLINTGCMLIDLRKPWVDNIWFEFEDRILRDPKGRFHAVCQPEDWKLSHHARALGAKIFATREIKVVHHGNKGYANDHVWGTVKRDSLDGNVSG